MIGPQLVIRVGRFFQINQPVCDGNLPLDLLRVENLLSALFKKREGHAKVVGLFFIFRDGRRADGENSQELLKVLFRAAPTVEAKDFRDEIPLALLRQIRAQAEGGPTRKPRQKLVPSLLRVEEVCDIRNRRLQTRHGDVLAVEAMKRVRPLGNVVCVRTTDENLPEGIQKVAQKLTVRPVRFT